MPKLPSVLLLYNAPGAAAVSATCRESDAGVLEEVAAVAAALTELQVSHRQAAIASLAELPPVLAASGEGVVFNLVESLAGEADAVNSVPALCAAYGKACTGASSATLQLCLDKERTKAVLQAGGVPVPRGVAVAVNTQPSLESLPPGALLIKPCHTDGSEGIEAENCVFSRADERVLTGIRRLHERFGQTVLVEEFFGERELQAALVTVNGQPKLLAVAEIDFKDFPAGQPRLVDYAAKWLPESFAYHHTPRIVPAPLAPAMQQEVERLAVLAWELSGRPDYSRVDFRADAAGRLAVLEVNPNPDIAPDAGYAAALTAAGMPYREFVRTLVIDAYERLPRLVIRPTVQADRDAVLHACEATGFFNPAELAIAAEVLDDAIHRGLASDYHSRTAIVHGRVAGWICYGHTACTEATWDIYWIAVDPGCQGQGVGAALMRHAEAEIRRKGGKMAVLDTSGRAQYVPTRGFYLKQGFALAAELADFYAPGDAKVIFIKALV